MKMVAEYLEKAIDFEKMAAKELDSAFKANLLEQAADYRKLADERVRRLNLPLPPRPPQSN
jgi:hypothetical protein